MEAFCIQHLRELAMDDWSLLPSTSQDFLQELDLPALHPFCNESSHTLLSPSAPDMGPPTESFSDNYVEAFITNWSYYVPPSIALFLVWFFLFAGYVAPLGTIVLLCSRKRNNGHSVMDLHPLLSSLTLVASWVVMTDDQYVFEYGRVPGIMLFAVSSFSCGVTRKHIALLLLLLSICFNISPWNAEDPKNIPTTIQSGLYFNTDNDLIQEIVSKWRTSLPEYSSIATPFWLTGDARTGMQYTFGYVSDPPTFHRVWLPTFDQEYVGLDVAFPKSGHDTEKPLYLVLHGLNGGSREGYVIDFCHDRNKAGSICVVLTARGLGGTPIQGWTFFHGARVDDAHAAASILRDRVRKDGQVLAGVGYSLGAIVLNHYVASFGNEVALDVSVAISGALDCTFQQTYNRSQRIWQSMIMAHMKDHFLYSKWGDRIIRQIGRQDFQKLMRANDIVEADQYIGVQYNGYDDHRSFYSDMSAILASNGTGQSGHFAIPHLVLQSFDDPISTWRTNVADEPSSVLFPKRIVQQESNNNLVILLTDKGGHVGWPVGYFPHTWEYMNNLVAAGFVKSYAECVNASKVSMRQPENGQNPPDGCEMVGPMNSTAVASTAQRPLPIVSLDQICD